MSQTSPDSSTESHPSAPDSVVMTTLMLKAIAHPVRRSIQRALSRLSHARAADLARELELPANQISFHLRVLADAGLVVEAPEHARDRRDRVWKPNPLSLTVSSAREGDEEIRQLVLRGFEHEAHELLRRAYLWAENAKDEDEKEPAATVSHFSVHLSHEEYERLLGAVHDAVAAARAAATATPDVARHYWEFVLAAANEKA